MTSRARSPCCPAYSLFPSSFWLSVPLGIFITMLCFSGATLVYEQEITQCLRRLYYVDEVKPATLPVDTDGEGAGHPAAYGLLPLAAAAEEPSEKADKGIKKRRERVIQLALSCICTYCVFLAKVISPAEPPAVPATAAAQAGRCPS